MPYRTNLATLPASTKKWLPNTKVIASFTTGLGAIVVNAVASGGFGHTELAALGTLAVATVAAYLKSEGLD